MWTDPGCRDLGLRLLQAFLELCWWTQAEGEDVPIISSRQYKLVVIATTDVPQVSVLVVVDAESPVRLHGSEVVVPRLQGVNPDEA